MRKFSFSDTFTLSMTPCTRSARFLVFSDRMKKVLILPNQGVVVLPFFTMIRFVVTTQVELPSWYSWWTPCRYCFTASRACSFRQTRIVDTVHKTLFYHLWKFGLNPLSNFWENAVFLNLSSPCCILQGEPVLRYYFTNWITPVDVI